MRADPGPFGTNLELASKATNSGPLQPPRRSQNAAEGQGFARIMALTQRFTLSGPGACFGS